MKETELLPPKPPSITGVVLLVSPHVNLFVNQLVDNLSRLTLPFDELLIVASGLSRKALSLVQNELARLPKAWNHRIIRAPLGPVGANRNIGLDEAVSDLVTFLDSDDVYAPDYCRFIADFFEKKEFDALLHGFFIMEDGKFDQARFPRFSGLGLSPYKRVGSDAFVRLDQLLLVQNPTKIVEPSLKFAQPKRAFPIHQGHMTLRRQGSPRFHTNPLARNEDGVFLNMALNAGLKIDAVDVKISAYNPYSSAQPAPYRLLRAPRDLLNRLRSKNPSAPPS